MSYLILVRHGQSEWNALGKWTGWTDINLNEEGRKDARRAAEGIKDIRIDKAYTSDLKRAQQTLEEIVKLIDIKDVPTIKAAELKERNYGDLTGKNKWKIKEEYGDDQFTRWRRSWDEPIPNGETLKDVYNRVIPYYSKIILPDLLDDKNVIVAAHGNSLRALVKYLENIPDDEISKLEYGLGEIYLYTIDKEGKVVNKEIRATNPNTGKI